MVWDFQNVTFIFNYYLGFASRPQMIMLTTNKILLSDEFLIIFLYPRISKLSSWLLIKEFRRLASAFSTSIILNGKFGDHN
jgi:hypothetical protein